MKKAFLILFTVIAVLFTASCIKDKCGNVICLHSGVCVDGVCACRTGYEGKTCETEWSAKFSGNWHASETYFRSTEHHQYVINIDKTGNADSFVIYNLADSMYVLCRQNKFNSFVFIPDQKINDTLTIKSGNGTLDSAGTKVTGLYSFQFKDTTITTNFSWTR